MAVDEVLPGRLCVYHGGCPDGFGAAWVLWRHFGEHGMVFIPARYGDAPPCVTGRDIYIVDFSYDRDTLVALEAEADSILVLDHHKTNEENLKGLYFAKFDMNTSGAVMAWNYFCGNKPLPGLLAYVQDRDLWKWELDNTKDILATIYSYPFDFELWNTFQADIELNNCEDMLNEGQAINRERDRQINSMLSGWAITRADIGGHNVPVLNCPRVIASEVLNKLAVGEPFAAAYFDSENDREWELRSVNGGVDVSQIARMYGGGGHKHAAGFKWIKPDVIVEV